MSLRGAIINVTPSVAWESFPRKPSTHIDSLYVGFFIRFLSLKYLSLRAKRGNLFHNASILEIATSLRSSQNHFRPPFTHKKRQEYRSRLIVDCSHLLVNHYQLVILVLILHHNCNRTVIIDYCDHIHLVFL